MEVPVFGDILIRVQSIYGKIRTGITPNTDTFHAVQESAYFTVSNLLRRPHKLYYTFHKTCLQQI